MVVFHKVEACRRCRGVTMWRLTDGRFHCDRCHRRKSFPKFQPSARVMAILLGALVIGLAAITFAVGADRLPTGNH